MSSSDRLPCQASDVAVRCRTPYAVALLAALSVALGGCAAGSGDHASMMAGPTITYSQQIPPYSPSFVVSGTQTGEFYVQIFGQPFPQQMTDLSIAQYIGMPQWLGPTAATTLPGDRVNRNFRAVLVFNPAFKGPPGELACRAPGRIETLPPRAGIVRVAAGFCVGDRIASYLVAEQSRLNDAGDPAFAALMSQVMLLLLPDRNPNRPGSMPGLDLPD